MTVHAAEFSLRELADADTSLQSARFSELCRCVMLGRGFRNAEAHTRSGYVRDVLKAAASPALLGDAFWNDSKYRALASGFLASLRRSAVFDAALPFMLRLPPNQRVVVASTPGIVGDIVGEGAAKPIKQTALEGLSLDDLKKLIAIIVASKELLTLAPEASERLLRAELQNAVIAVTDKEFLAYLISQTTPQAASGSTSTALLADIASLVGAMGLSAESRLFLVMEPGPIARLAVRGGDAGLTFPNLGVGGGTLANITVMASDQLSAGQALLFDARGIAAWSDDLQVHAAEHASIQTDSAPANPTIASTVLISLWQRDLVGLRAERYAAWEVIRANAVKSLSGVAY